MFFLLFITKWYTGKVNLTTESLKYDKNPNLIILKVKFYKIYKL